jgi:hypothetical protein
LEERIALDNLKDYLFDCISIRLGVGQYFIDIAPVSPLQTSSKSVSYQALGEVFCDSVSDKKLESGCRRGGVAYEALRTLRTANGSKFPSG